MNQLQMINRMLFGGGISIPADTIVYYKFNNNLTDSSPIGNNGIGSGTYTFGTDRHGNSNSAIEFTDGLITTTNNVDLSTTDKVTLSFWFKTSQTAPSIFIELSQNALAYNAFLSGLNIVGLDGLNMINHTTVNNWRYTTESYYNLNWHHAFITCDRGLNDLSETQIWINNVSKTLSNNGANDLIGNFDANHKLYVGKRYNNTYNFVGLMDDLRIYPRILTSEERILLYNE